MSSNGFTPVNGDASPEKFHVSGNRPKRAGATPGSNGKKVGDGQLSSKAVKEYLERDKSSSSEHDDSNDDDFNVTNEQNGSPKRKIYHKMYNPENASPSNKAAGSSDADLSDDELSPPSKPTTPRVDRKYAANSENRLRKAPDGGWATGIPMPKKGEDLQPWDQMMIQRRDTGEIWTTIVPDWEAMTGTKLAHSTLPNRYSRIKALNTEFTPDEDTVLLQTKVIVEDTFEKEKWNMIHKAVEARLGRKVVDRGCERRFQYLVSGDMEQVDAEEEGEGSDAEGDGNQQDDEGEAEGGAEGNGVDDDHMDFEREYGL